MNRVLIAIAIFFFITPVSFVRAGVDDGVDYVSVAKTLIKNGAVQRARSTLNKIDLENDDYNVNSYHLVNGIILLKEKKYEDSLKELFLALKMLKSKEIHLYISESYFRSKKYLKALKHINLVEARNISFYLLKSSILSALDEHEKAWSVLVLAESLGLDKLLVAKKKFQFLITRKLYYSARDLVEKSIKSFSVKDLVAFAQIFLKEKQTSHSIHLLEVGKLHHSKNEGLVMQLAFAYAQNKQVYSASLIAEELGRLNKNVANEVSELLRSSGQAYRVAFQSKNVEDHSLRLKQRLAIYLETEKFGFITAMESLLKDVKLLDQQDIRYAVAYAFYKTGRFKKTKNYLSQITRDDLFEKATELRSEIEKCSNNRWLCRALL